MVGVVFKRNPLADAYWSIKLNTLTSRFVIVMHAPVVCRDSIGST